MTAKIIPFPKPKPAPEPEDHSVKAMLAKLKEARNRK